MWYMGIRFFVLRKMFMVPEHFITSRVKIGYKIWKRVVIFILCLVPLNIFFTSHSLEEKVPLSVQILIDVSLSMSADDVKPQRFEALIRSLQNLITQLTGVQIHVILFSWIPFEYISWSSDIRLINQKLKDTLLSDIPPTNDFVWTAIGDAMLLGIRSLEYMPQFSGILLLLTDGDSNKGYNPKQVLGLLQKKKIPVYSFGIGNSDYQIGKGHDGAVISTTINLELIEQLATATQWRFYRIQNAPDFEKSFQDMISRLNLQPVVSIQEHRMYLNSLLYQLLIVWLLWWMIVFLFWYIKIQMSNKT